MINCIGQYKAERVTCENENFFFGYYDLSPESGDGRYILAGKAPFIDRMPKIGDNLEIGYFENGSKTFRKTGETDAWNFQEGCRLQWLTDTEFIYNHRTDSGFGSSVYDINEKKVVRSYDAPVYSISRSLKIATSYGFVNNKYNYPHKVEEEAENKWGDGVYILDLTTGESHCAVPLQKLVEITRTGHCKNWVEYCSFDPSGTRFFIYHRWDDKKGNVGTHLCVGDPQGNVNTLLISRFVSHAGWKDAENLTSWCRLPSKINAIQKNDRINSSILFKFAKKIYHALIKNPALRQKVNNDAYVTFNAVNGGNAKINNPDFTSDGHCTWSTNKRYMLTDTYPDRENNRNLLLFDEPENKVYHLGAFYSYPAGMEKKNPIWNISPLRCDLHPEWGANGKYIYFDSVHEGYRGLYRIDISGLTAR